MAYSVSCGLIKMIKQFVPQEVCLQCKGCCRFSEQDSVWSPCLLDEEMQALIDKDLPSAFISGQRKILPVPCQKDNNYVCPFLDLAASTCRIYNSRPFECQLYPFLISLRGKKVFLTVDINCPYVKEKMNTKELKDYAEYLFSFLNSPEQIHILRDNPHLIQAYEEVLDLLELSVDENQQQA